MDVLGKLELRIEQLLARFKSLGDDNLRLGAELAAAKRENIVLTQENAALREAIAAQERLRLAALGRLERVLLSIKDYGTGAHSSES